MANRRADKQEFADVDGPLFLSCKERARDNGRRLPGTCQAVLRAQGQTRKNAALRPPGRRPASK